jgi:hypothetical protein
MHSRSDFPGRAAACGFGVEGVKTVHPPYVFF